MDNCESLVPECAPIAFPERLSGTQCASAEDVSPVLQAQNPTAVAYEAESEGQRAESQEPQAYTLHGSREGTQAVASPTDTAGTIREGVGTAIQNSSTTVALSESPSLRVSSSPSLATQWRVRRLTPEECELLQGFPIGYTLIPGTSSKKRKGEDLSDTIDYLISLGVSPAEAEVLAHSPDGPRYKALGNSWAVPVARWIARRIDACAKALSRQ